jgi:hypothetical protein
MKLRKHHKKLIKLFIASYITSAICLSLFELSIRGNILSILLVGLVGSAILAIFVTLLTFGFTFAKRRVWWITLVQFLFIPLICGLIAFPLSYLVQRLPTGSWVQIPSPPEPIDRFLKTGDSSIFGANLLVQSTSGNVYSYDCVTYGNCEWSLSSANGNIEGDSFCRDTSKLYGALTPLPPGKVIEKYQIVGCGFDYETSVTFIHLADGRLFFWTSFWNVYDTIWSMLSCVIGGLVTGLVTTIVSIFMRPITDPKSILANVDSSMTNPRLE